LNVTVSSFGSSALINDLNAVPIDPFQPELAKEFIHEVLSTYNYHIKEDELNYLLYKVQWHIPFYFQLMIQELMRLVPKTVSITYEIIDEAFIQVTDKRNDHLFDHYVSRLKRLYLGNHLLFVKKFLNELAKAGELSRDNAINLGHELTSEAETRHILDSLLFDGYIVLVKNKDKMYEFNSLFLKTWWYNHEC
jgi:hypothetical protein